MSDSTVPAIDMKQREQKKTTSLSGTSNANDTAQWGAFFKNVGIAFSIVMIISYIGANFVTLINFEPLKLLLPIDKIHYFNNKTPIKPKPKPVRNNSLPCKNDSETCNTGFSVPSISDLGIDGNAYGWPYSMRREGNFISIFQDFANWFAETTSESYMWLRNVNYDMLSSPILKAMSPIILYCFVAPPIVAFAPIILPFIASFIILPFSGFTSGNLGWLWTLLGLFFVWTPLMMGCNKLIQYLQMLVLFLIMPIWVNYDNFWKIWLDNAWWLGNLFGFFVAASGFTTLGVFPGAAMMIAWAITVYLLKRK